MEQINRFSHSNSVAMQGGNANTSSNNGPAAESARYAHTSPHDPLGEHTIALNLAELSLRLHLEMCSM
jgi:hypothetical protein